MNNGEEEAMKRVWTAEREEAEVSLRHFGLGSMFAHTSSFMSDSSKFVLSYSSERSSSLFHSHVYRYLKTLCVNASH